MRQSVATTCVQKLAEKCGPIIERKEPTANQAEAIKLADAMARQIDGELMDKMGDNTPSMMEMNKHLK